MRLNYQTTIDEILTTQMLWLRDTKVFQKWILWGLLYWLAIASAIVYFAHGPLANKLIGGILMGGIVGGNMVFNHKTIIRRRTRKFLLKKLGSEGPFPASLAMDKEKIEYSSNDTSISFNLKGLSQLENVENGLLLDFAMGNIIYIPDSAFKSREGKNEWIKALNQYCGNYT